MNDDDEMGRDPEVARALDGIVVPAYEPGFWDRLGARLEQEGAPARGEEVPHVVVAAPLEPFEAAAVPALDLPAVVPLAARREQRRSLVALAVAAAAILAIVAVRLGTSDPDTLSVAGEGGTVQLAPDDGTTSPDAASEHDGARREGDDDGPSSADQRSDSPRGTAGDDPQTLLAPGTTARGGSEGTDTDAPTAATLAAPRTAQEAFLAWAGAVDRGDTDAALALTGPRTIAYYDALGADMDDVLTESQEGWGAWADPDDRAVQAFELGQVDGDRAVGLVLDRPDPSNDDADVRVYDSVPVVKGDAGWQVEFAAFDPGRDGRIELISPAPGTYGQDLAKGEVIRVAALRTGEYYLNLDASQSTRIDAADAVDGEITWDPSGLRSTTDTEHLLVVAHLDEGEVTMLVATFQTRPA